MQFKNRKVCNESNKKATINPFPIVGDFLYTSLIKLSHLREKQFLRFGSSSELSAADPPAEYKVCIITRSDLSDPVFHAKTLRWCLRHCADHFMERHSQEKEF